MGDRENENSKAQEAYDLHKKALPTGTKDSPSVLIEKGGVVAKLAGLLVFKRDSIGGFEVKTQGDTGIITIPPSKRKK